MNKKKSILVALLATGLFTWMVFAGDGQTQTQAKASAQEKPMSPEMAAMAKAAAPGEHHKHIAALAGKWNVTTTVYMPGAAPMISQGTSENTMIFGGRHMQQTFDSEMMGMPFSGIGFIGYDNGTKEYYATWMDSMSTGFFVSHGACSENGTVITTFGDTVDPMSGMTVKVKAVTRVVSKDKHTFSYFIGMPDGSWVLNMEMTYIRK